MLDFRVPGACNCAKCQFITKAVIYVSDDPDQLLCVSDVRFEDDLNLSEVEFFENMDNRATVQVLDHSQRWQ